MIRSMLKRVATSIGAAAAISASAAAEAPTTFTVSHHGRLLLGADEPVNNDALEMVFKLRTISAPIEDEAAPLWTATYKVRVRDGYYAVSLGSGGTPLTTEMLANPSSLYLELLVGGIALSPRYRIGAVPIAHQASNALSLGGKAPEEYALKSDLSGIQNVLTNGTYDKAAIDAKVTAINAAIAQKASAGDVSQLLTGTYTKAEVDAAVGQKASNADFQDFMGRVYEKSQTYSNVEVDAKVAPTVKTTGTYADPAWLTSLGAGKITGTVGSAASFTGNLLGDITGTQGATLVTALRGFPVLATPPTARQTLTWNGSAWAPINRSAPVALTDAATIVVNAALGTVFDVTLGGNRTIANPSNLVDGETYTFRIKQDGTGSRVATWGTSYMFEGATGTQTMSGTPNSVTIVSFVSDGSNLFATATYNLGSSLIGSTGGVVTTVGGYRIHTFNSSGTFQSSGTGRVEVLVVAGGGSGGNRNTTNGNGGGGGGGVVYSPSYQVTNTGYAVVVGDGGAGVSGVSNGNNGGNSTFGTLVAIGGGGGASSGTGTTAGSGGSGGGGAGGGGGPGTSTQTGGFGFAGGAGITWSGGGGGGAGGPGVGGTGGAPGGNGGPGYASAISGSTVRYAGGGGGGGNTSEWGGDGYDGGGRGFGSTSLDGWTTYTNAINPSTRGNRTLNAIPNTGGGGGGGSIYWTSTNLPNANSGAGGSGIVIIRYLP